MKILKKLKLRLKALQAHETFGDVIEIDKSGRWHPLVGNYAGCWGAWLNGNNRIIVEPHGPKPGPATEATVVEVEDYH